jgi:hypothetical protein
VTAAQDDRSKQQSAKVPFRMRGLGERLEEDMMVWQASRTTVAFVFAASVLLMGGCTNDGVAVLAVDSPTVQFGDVPVGEFADRTITVRNDGGGSVQLLDAVVSGDQAASFTVLTSLTGTELDSNSSAELALRFTAGSVGPHEALLVVSGTQPSLSGGGGSAATQTVFPVQLTLLGAGISGDDDDSSGDDDTGDDDTGDDDTVGDDDDKLPGSGSAASGTSQPRINSGGGDANSTQVILRNTSIQSGGGTSDGPSHRLEGSM